MAKIFYFLCQLEEYCFVQLDSLTPNACICIATSLTTAEQNVGGTMWNTAPYSLRWLPWIPEVVSGRTGAPGPANTITSSAFTNVCRHNIINLVKMHYIKMTLKKWRKWDKLFTFNFFSPLKNFNKYFLSYYSQVLNVRLQFSTNNMAWVSFLPYSQIVTQSVYTQCTKTNFYSHEPFDQ